MMNEPAMCGSMNRRYFTIFVRKYVNWILS
jgi:hypothetical protein